MLTWLGRWSDDIRKAKEAPHTVTSFFDAQLTLADLPLAVKLRQVHLSHSIQLAWAQRALMLRGSWHKLATRPCCWNPIISYILPA